MVEAFQSLSERPSRDKPGRNPDLESQRARYERGEGTRGPVLDSRSQPAQIPAEKTFLGGFFFFPSFDMIFAEGFAQPCVKINTKILKDEK